MLGASFVWRTAQMRRIKFRFQKNCSRAVYFSASAWRGWDFDTGLFPAYLAELRVASFRVVLEVRA